MVTTTLLVGFDRQSPYGFAIACDDGDGDQYLMGINDEGGVSPFARNVYNSSELAGATFHRVGGRCS
jgi:hypothetical protein